MKKVVLLLALIYLGISCFACTTFCLQKNGQIIFGRNYDWVSGAGIIHTNQRGLLKSTTGQSPIFQWVSSYGSITFNQYGKEFPTGGMNEKGLVVELMWLDGTRYPEPDERPELGVLRWIQYQLDNNATVKEVINSDKKIRIRKSDTPIHYLIADAGGDVASIEFLEGNMIVHTGIELPFPVLTNSTYQQSLQVADQHIKTNTLPADNSLQRFVTACSMVNKLNTEDVKMPLPDYAFSILDKVSQQGHTRWSIVYDVINRVVHFKTDAFQTIKTFSLNGFEFNCSNQPKMYDMNQAGRGDITKKFTAPDAMVKKAVLDKAVLESQQQVKIGETEKKFLLEYEHTVTCK